MQRFLKLLHNLERTKSFAVFNRVARNTRKKIQQFEVAIYLLPDARAQQFNDNVRTVWQVRTVNLSNRRSSQWLFVTPR